MIKVGQLDNAYMILFLYFEGYKATSRTSMRKTN